MLNATIKEGVTKHSELNNETILILSLSLITTSDRFKLILYVVS